MADRHYLQQLSRALTDKGRLIEAGWVEYRLRCISPSAHSQQLEELRFAWMASAQHVFGSFVDAMEAGADPTEADVRRLNMIAEELHDVTDELALRLRRGPR